MDKLRRDLWRGEFLLNEVTASTHGGGAARVINAHVGKQKLFYFLNTCFVYSCTIYILNKFKIYTILHKFYKPCPNLCAYNLSDILSLVGITDL